MTDEDPTTHTDSRGHLRAVFTVDPHPDAECAVLASGARSDRVTQTIVCESGHCKSGCQCRSEVTLADTGKTQFVEGTVADRCICPVLRSHDCIASIERFERDSLEVVVSVPDRSELEAIVEQLRETGATVRLQRISTSTEGGDSRRVEIDTDGITAKQREAVLVAVQEGYYERPRRADLGDLADALGVSKSAVSQRLSAVESNLITSLFERETARAADQ